ncbi:hypothetical protein SRHO_G00205380 [Serrasalmus rhombeus]
MELIDRMDHHWLGSWLPPTSPPPPVQQGSTTTTAVIEIDSLCTHKEITDGFSLTKQDLRPLFSTRNMMQNSLFLVGILSNTAGHQ